MIRLAPAEARAWIDGGRAIVLDVRSPEEFAAGALPGALNAPWPRMKRPVSVLGRDTPVILYCESGSRARKAAEVMVGMGFTRVYLLGAMRRYHDAAD